MPRSFLLKSDGKLYGPVDAAKLKNLARTGRLKPDSLICLNDGKKAWVAAARIQGLFPEEPPAAMPRLSRISAQQFENAAASTPPPPPPPPIQPIAASSSGSNPGTGGQGVSSNRSPQSDPGRVSSFMRESLLPNESIVYVARIHWLTIIVPACWLTFFFVSALMLVIVAPLLAVLPLLAIPFAAYALIKAAIILKTRECVLTEHRVIGKYGLIRRGIVEMLLSQIEGVSVSQGISGRIFGFGTVRISGTGGSAKWFAGIERPFDFRKIIQSRTPKLMSPMST